MGYTTLKATYDEGDDTKTINVNYVIVDIMLPYNIILECTTINILGAVVSTRYITLRYSLLEGRVGTIPGGQQVAREFYLSILETTKE